MLGQKPRSAELTSDTVLKPTLFGGLLTGRAQVGGVAIAEGESTAITAARSANAAKQSKTAAEMAESLSNEIGKNSVQYRTPNSVGHIDLKAKPTMTSLAVATPPHRMFSNDRFIFNVGRQTTLPATKQDIRIARRLVERRKQ